MIVGFVGSGSMAAAMARGWAGRVRADAVLRLRLRPGARRWPRSSAARRSPTPRSRARADLVVLAVKPAKLDEVAAGAGGGEGGRLAARGDARWSALRRPFPAPRLHPRDAERRGRGAAAACSASPAPAVAGRCGRSSALLGHVVELRDEDFDAATAVMGCAPAYLALAVEAIADAGAADGLDPELARELVVETTAGTAELLRDPPPGRRAQGGRLARRQHRGRARGARARGRPRGLRGRGAGLAGEDAGDDPAGRSAAATSPTTSTRSSSSTSS